MYFTGVIIAVSTFLIIGIFHPIVIKTEYYTAALFIENVIVSSIFGVVGASFLWSIGELFDQRKRVLKGWFPMNPKRKHEYGKQ